MLRFRNLLWFRFTPDTVLSEGLLNEERLNEALERESFVPCALSAAQSSGFISPSPDQSESLAYSRLGFHLIALQTEERILPASVVTDQLSERAAALEQQQGYKLSRKARQQLKEDIRLDLLPRAFTKRSRVNALICPDQGWIAIDSSSSNKAEALLNQLRAALGSLSVELEVSGTSVEQLMTGWVKDNGRSLDPFLLSDWIELYDPMERERTVRLKNHDLQQPEVQAHLESGLLCSRLALTWHERWRFLLNTEIKVTQLKPLEGYLDAVEAELDPSEDPQAAFDAEFVHLALELKQLITDLRALLNLEEPS